jgi:hypothetical protein
MIRKADAIRYRAEERGADEGEVGLVGAHLAARRRERRVMLTCSVLAVMGLVWLGLEYAQSLSVSTGLVLSSDGEPPSAPRRKGP